MKTKLQLTEEALEAANHRIDKWYHNISVVKEAIIHHRRTNEALAAFKEPEPATHEVRVECETCHNTGMTSTAIGYGDVDFSPCPVCCPAIDGDFYKGIEWLACWMLDNVEGETVTEESLRSWATKAWETRKEPAINGGKDTKPDTVTISRKVVANLLRCVEISHDMHKLLSDHDLDKLKTALDQPSLELYDCTHK